MVEVAKKQKVSGRGSTQLAAVHDLQCHLLSRILELQQIFLEVEKERQALQEGTSND